jgi:glycine betaine/choline ABC-type transport system substrate-binding protein
MMAILIEENLDIRVERKVNLGGSNVAWQAAREFLVEPGLIEG